MYFSFENDFEKKKFISLLKQHQLNIDYLHYMDNILLDNQSFMNPLFIEEIKKEGPLKKREKLIESLLKKYPTDSNFIANNIVWDCHFLYIDEYLFNPYLQVLKSISFNEKGWTLKQEKIPSYNLFVSDDKYASGSNMTLKPSFGFFDKPFFCPSIFLENNKQMSLTPLKIKTMQIPIMVAKGKVLILGMGLGYFAYMTSLKENIKEVHIVEDNSRLINLFYKYFLPLFPFKEKIYIHKADAFLFAEKIKDHDYDFIFSNLWNESNEGLTSYLSLRRKFDSFKYTKRYYWLESSIISYLRLLVIDVLSDEFYQIEGDYDEIKSQIKHSLQPLVLKNTYDLDALLNIKGLLKTMLTN